MGRHYVNLQHFLDETGLSRKNLAKLAGVSPGRITQIMDKDRRASLDLALRLSRITQVPVERLIKWRYDLDGLLVHQYPHSKAGRKPGQRPRKSLLNRSESDNTCSVNALSSAQRRDREHDPA